MGLVIGCDGAYPFTPPAGCQIVLGYVGEAGETPHVWTTAEIEAARQGHWFAPIWTPPQSANFDGVAAADGMASALGALGYPEDGPVFLDVERSTWDAGGAGSANNWQTRMQSHGYTQPYCYGREWVAHWDLPAGEIGPAPTVLPAGCIGEQYADAGPYDLSVFDDSLPWWGKPAPQPSPSPASYPYDFLLEELMANGVFLDQDDALTWFARWRWQSYLLRNYGQKAGDDALEKGLVANLKAKGAAWYEWYVQNCAEAQKDEAQIRKDLGLPPAP